MSGRWRIGLGAVLFTVYCVAYAVFVGIAAFSTFRGGQAAGGLAAAGPAGLPWGVAGGFLLIAGAFCLALLYAAFAGRSIDGGRS